MDALLDAAIREAYACAPQDVIVLHTLEISHPAFTEPVRVARWNVTDNEPARFKMRLEDDAVYDPGRIVEFIGLPFEITLPQKNTDSPGEFVLRLDNVGDALDEHLEAAALSGGTITAVYREYIKGEESSGPRSIWGGISIKSPRMEGQTITAQGSVLDWMFWPFGSLITPEKYPAAVRGR